MPSDAPRVTSLETLRKAAAETPGESPGQLDRAVTRLAQLRNSLVHARPTTPTPAYSLDEED